MRRKLSYNELESKVKLLQRQLRDHQSACRQQVEHERLQGVLEMAGAVCHELSQPMQVLSIYCERFLNETSRKNPVYKEVENIMDKIDRIASVTRKLQTIASYETKDYIEGKKIIDIDKASQAA